MKWMIAAPEIWTFIAALWFLVLPFLTRTAPEREHRTSLGLAALTVLVSLFSLNTEGYLFIKAYRVDFFSQLFKLMLSVGLFLVLTLCGKMTDVRERNRNDFFFLIFLCTLAMMLLVSADHLLGIFIALELSSYSLYILVALRKDEGPGVEAALKYFLAGTFASAIMLFGLALLYASTQTAYLSELARTLPHALPSPTVFLGLLLVLGGFFFKLAVFPFHFWAPDTYQGAMNQVAAYIATASKVAAIAVLIRFVASSAEGSTTMVHVLVVLSIVSMTLGNLAAMAQKDLKRLLAFSTVAHSGYVLIGVLAMSRTGYAGAVFYALALLMMKFTIFLVVVKVAHGGRNPQVEDLAGLHRQSPLLALALMVSLFSLAGIPPTVGFTGKFLLFMAAMEKGYFTLVLIAMINVVISLYYYLQVLKAAYLLEPPGEVPPRRLSPSMRILTGLMAAAIIIAGFFPTYLIELTDTAARVLVGG